jgi:hypothetical protein
LVRAAASAKVWVALAIEPVALAAIIIVAGLAACGAETAFEFSTTGIGAGAELFAGDIESVAIAVGLFVARAGVIARDERLSLVMFPGIIKGEPVIEVTTGGGLFATGNSTGGVVGGPERRGIFGSGWVREHVAEDLEA